MNRNVGLLFCAGVCTNVIMYLQSIINRSFPQAGHIKIYRKTVSEKFQRKTLIEIQQSKINCAIFNF